MLKTSDFLPLNVDIAQIALERFCEDLGTRLDLTAPSHRKALENFKENMRLLRAGKVLPRIKRAHCEHHSLFFENCIACHEAAKINF